MKLQSKFLLWSTLALVCVIALGTFSIWNLVALRRTARAAAAEYEAMDRAEATVVQIAWLRDVLRGPSAQTYRDARFFAPIEKEVSEIVVLLRSAAGAEDGDGAKELQQGDSAANHLKAAAQQSGGNAADQSASKAADELEQVRQSLLNVAKLVPDSTRRQITGAGDRLLVRIEWTCIWLLIVLVVSALIHFQQYRLLVRPLLWLRDDMRQSAASNWREKVRERGEREFKDVAAVFNGLAKELAELYRSLEDKVIQRSRELVRSERLASVGFLAAGVAHEINNPLSVISGYAELAAKSLGRVMNGDRAEATPMNAAEAEAEAEALASALEAQRLIHDEAFRCKEITSRLLSLARGGKDERQSLHLDDVARQVTTLTRGLKNYRDRHVVLEFESSEPLEVVANPTEMKQVLLNLTVNALEAVQPQRGEVRIAGRRAGDWVEVSVQDNGKGMNAATLQNVFEPFFTAKRGAGEPGTGLGLSITHAIVENHGGQIVAESSGPGRGSRFTVRLPRSAINRSGTSVAVAGASE